jgi:phosphoketolase
MAAPAGSVLPQMKVRVVNVVDLMTLPRPKDHPHGMSETLFTELFTDTVDVIFALDAINNSKRLPRGATELKAWC